MSCVWALLLLRTFESPGVDVMQGHPGRGSNTPIRGSEVLQEHGHGWAGLPTEVPESTHGVTQDVRVCVVKIGTQSWNYVRGAVSRQPHFILDRSESSEHNDGQG